MATVISREELDAFYAGRRVVITPEARLRMRASEDPRWAMWKDLRKVELAILLGRNTLPW